MTPFLLDGLSGRISLIVSLFRYKFLMVIVLMYEWFSSITLQDRAILKQDIKHSFVTPLHFNLDILHSVCSVVGTSDDT